jgi:hypothetical protein
MKRTLLFFAAAAALAALAVACSQSNVGASCQLSLGEVCYNTNIVELNVASNCDEYWCISYRGSRPYCSHDCTLDGKCPEGYRCLKQELSPLDPTIVGKNFCVPKSPPTCTIDQNCNPQCDGVPYCKPDYYCQRGYCSPISCSPDYDGGVVPDGGGAPDGGV